jgi:DNA repair exonuclease SbcCD ATPase subunit
MVEQNHGTQQTAGQEPEPRTDDPHGSATPPQQGALASQQPGQQQQHQQTWETEIQQLRQANDRHRQQIEGSAAEARRLREQNEELQQNYTALQQQLQQIGTALTGGNPNAQQTPQTASEALQRFLSGDDSAVNGYFNPQNRDEHVRNLVNEQMTAALNILQRQQIPFQAHPELADVNSPVRRDILEAYDREVADPIVQMMFPQDQNMLVPLVGADGQQKQYDLRLLDRAALRAKQRVVAEQATQQEHRRQQVGDVATADGGAGGENAIDPLEMFSDSEIRQFMDHDVQRALPPEVRGDPKRVTQYLWDEMNDTSRNKRFEAYQARQRGRTA